LFLFCIYVSVLICLLSLLFFSVSFSFYILYRRFVLVLVFLVNICFSVSPKPRTLARLLDACIYRDKNCILRKSHDGLCAFGGVEPVPVN